MNIVMRYRVRDRFKKIYIFNTAYRKYLNTLLYKIFWSFININITRHDYYDWSSLKQIQKYMYIRITGFIKKAIISKFQ